MLIVGIMCNIIEHSFIDIPKMGPQTIFDLTLSYSNVYFRTNITFSRVYYARFPAVTFLGAANIDIGGVVEDVFFVVGVK